MEKNDFVFNKWNAMAVAFSVCLIFIGFCLMSGGGSKDGTSFNEEIFSTVRIVVAPTISLIGFGTMIGAILLKGKENKEA